jgi:hypothetical protein
MAKKLLSKQDLCRIFGLYSEQTGIAYYQALREKVLTDEVLERLNIDKEAYKYRKVFTADESRRIIEHFQIEKHELEN